MATIEFWYEFTSPYSYPAAMGIEKTAAENDVQVQWKPFLLGPIFKAQGWDNSPFNIYPAKGAYMWRDMERICEAQNLAFTRPTIFPQNSLTAARLALCTVVAGHVADFTKLVYQAAFANQKDIFLPETLEQILKSLTIDPSVAFEQAGSLDVKAALRANTDAAMEKQIFGAPSFVTQDGELFWGNERLAQAVAWRAG